MSDDQPPVEPEPVRDTPVPPQLAAAIVAAYGELENLKKTHTAQAGSRQYDYADLGDLVEGSRGVLARHGLALLQPVTRYGADGPATVETWLLHQSGHLLRWPFDVPGAGGPQTVGSAITYARRYCGSGALGMAAEGQDDDGAAAQNAPPAQQPDTVPRKPLSGKDAQAHRTAHAMAMFAALGVPPGDRDARNRLTSQILKRDVQSWTDLTAREQNVVIADLIERRQRQEQTAREQAAADLEAEGRAAAWELELETMTDDGR